MLSYVNHVIERFCIASNYRWKGLSVGKATYLTLSASFIYVTVKRHPFMAYESGGEHKKGNQMCAKIQNKTKAQGT